MRETSLVISLKTGSNTIYEVRDEKVERWEAEKSLRVQTRSSWCRQKRILKRIAIFCFCHSFKRACGTIVERANGTKYNGLSNEGIVNQLQRVELRIGWKMIAKKIGQNVEKEHTRRTRRILAIRCERGAFLDGRTDGRINPFKDIRRRIEQTKKRWKK